MATSNNVVVQNINEERLQGPATRKQIYVELKKELGLPVVAHFTSFKYPVTITDDDAIMLEQILQKCDLREGFALIVSSPGGSGLAAERIINVCRAYSGSGKYVAVVPGKAKSAATMICLGASKILLGQASELGPIDPQIAIEKDKNVGWFSVFNIVKNSEKLSRPISKGSQ